MLTLVFSKKPQASMFSTKGWRQWFYEAFFIVHIPGCSFQTCWIKFILEKGEILNSHEENVMWKILCTFCVCKIFNIIGL